MKLSDGELLGAIKAAEEDAVGGTGGEIASDRADAIDRFLGKPYGDEQAGRSSAVSRDVSDVVEGVLANVLKPFVAGDKVVEFNPSGPEDEEAADQETDYINHVCLVKNNGFLVLNSAVKDALLLRAGYVLCDWTTRDDVLSENYAGLTDEDMALLMGDKEVEVVAHSEYPDPMHVSQPDPQTGQVMPPPMLHDVRLRRAVPTEYVRIQPVPPEEILVSGRCTTPSVQEADFLQHRTKLSLSDVRALGYDVPDDISDDDDGESVESMARARFSEYDALEDDPTADPARRLVEFKRTWIRIDRDGDGTAELRKVCHIGHTVLEDDEADMIPVAVFAAVAMPHQHLGISVYDLISDIARIKTALMRQYLDNKYLANNSRTAIDLDRVNVDDLLVSRPGGVVRVQGPPADAIFPLVTPDVGASALQGLEYLDTVRENRTGYTKAAEGLKSGSLATDTATEYMQQINQSQMRLEMIARTIAETGMRDLFPLVHALTLKHSTRADKVKLRNRWVVVNPREWVRRTDLSISVGLGTTSQGQQMQNLMLLAQAQEKVLALGLATPENVYNLLSKLVIAAGFKNPDLFFSKPGAPPPERKDPLVQAEEVKAQAMLQGKQVDGQIKQAELQQKEMLERERMAMDVGLEREKLQMEFDFKRWEKQVDLEADAKKALMDAEVKDREMQRRAEVDTYNADRAADTQRETARITARSAGVDVDGTDKVQAVVQPIVAELQTTLAELVRALGAPREVVRDPKTGRAIGTRSVSIQ